VNSNTISATCVPSNDRRILSQSVSVEYAITVETKNAGYTIKNTISGSNFRSTITAAIAANTNIADTVTVESTTSGVISGVLKGDIFFVTIDVNIQATDSILAKLPFNTAMVFSKKVDMSTHDTEFYLGDIVYSSITASALISAKIGTMNIKSLQLKQHDYTGVEKTYDVKTNEKLHFHQYDYNNTKNGVLNYRIEIEDAMFHASLDGITCSLVGEIEISYANTADGDGIYTIERRILSIPLNQERRVLYTDDSPTSNEEVLGEFELLLPKEEFIGSSWDVASTADFSTSQYGGAFFTGLAFVTLLYKYNRMSKIKESVYVALTEHNNEL